MHKLAWALVGVTEQDVRSIEQNRKIQNRGSQQCKFSRHRVHDIDVSHNPKHSERSRCHLDTKIAQTAVKYFPQCRRETVFHSSWRYKCMPKKSYFSCALESWKERINVKFAKFEYLSQNARNTSVQINSKIRKCANSNFKILTNTQHLS